MATPAQECNTSRSCKTTILPGKTMRLQTTCLTCVAPMHMTFEDL